MKLKLSILLGLIALSYNWSVAQDYDDIYYDGAKETKVAKTNNNNGANKYSNTKSYQYQNNSGTSYYTGRNYSERDVDEYNRHSSSSQNELADSSYYSSANQANDSTQQDFVYTDRIKRFHNPEIINQSSDPEVAQLYYVTTVPSVNLVIGSPSYYWGPSFGFSSYYDWSYSPWWDSWYGPSWGWYNSWYNPWYTSWWGPSWYYSSWYGPSWGWCGSRWYNDWYGPSYGWGGGHYWGGDYGRNPAYYSNGGGRRPFGNGNYGTPGTGRPSFNNNGINTASSRRPNISTQGNGSFGGNSTSMNGRRPMNNGMPQTVYSRPVPNSTASGRRSAFGSAQTTTGVAAQNNQGGTIMHRADPGANYNGSVSRRADFNNRATYRSSEGTPARQSSNSYYNNSGRRPSYNSESYNRSNSNSYTPSRSYNNNSNYSTPSRSSSSSYGGYSGGGFNGGGSRGSFGGGSSSGGFGGGGHRR